MGKPHFEGSDHSSELDTSYNTTAVRAQVQAQRPAPLGSILGEKLQNQDKIAGKAASKIKFQKNKNYFLR
jgi:hypothetical protein